MEKETKILIGAGALALAYYLFNVKKAAAAVSPIGKATMPPITTPVSPLATTPVSPLPDRVYPQPDSIAKAKAVAEAAALAAQQESDRLAEMRAYEEESARDKANQLANQAMLAEQEAAIVQAMLAEQEAAIVQAMLAEQDRQKAYLAEVEKKRLENEAAEAARQKEMNAFMYPTCPDGFEFYQNNCMPTYIIVEEKAKKGEGLILRDYINNKTTLVKTCPAEYVKQGINCTPLSALSPQQLQVLAMEEAGMVQTSDGQWYTNAAAAAAAQAIIDASKAAPAYSARQSSINEAICSVDRDGYINNPYSAVTNGMSLSQYIGEFKVTANELGIARASCPNSVYSSNLIAGGRADDNALGYKTIYKQGDCDDGYVYFPNYGCDKDKGSDEENMKFDMIVQQKLKNIVRRSGDPLVEY